MKLYSTIRTLASSAVLAAGLCVCIGPAGAQTTYENYSYKLTQSTGSQKFWTAAPTEKPFKSAAVPASSGSEVKVFAARNEFEPFLIAYQPTSTGNATITVGNFGSGIEVELYQVKYVNITTATDYLGQTGEYPDPLWPLASGASVQVTANQNTAFWFSVKVPKTTPAGDYTANMGIAGINIPVRLHVFGFTLPDQLSVPSLWQSVSYSTIQSKYGVAGTGPEYWDYVRRINQFLLDHHITPQNPLWPGGLTSGGAAPFINYDYQTRTIADNDGIWGFESPANNYLNGANLNAGAGFPMWAAASCKSNDPSVEQRPAPFAGLAPTAGDWYTGNNPGSAYNTRWFNYIQDVQAYLTRLHLLDKAYYYMANEPQDQADYDAMAWYSRYLSQAAPNLKLMVSEEPKPEIYNHANYVSDGQIDIWLAHYGMFFNPEISAERLKNHGEATWMYWLKSTYAPRFNPITIDHPGAESRMCGWFLWKHRLRGLGYYSFMNWGDNPWTTPRPNNQNGEYSLIYPPTENNSNIAYGANGHRFVSSIRLELIRDGLEDYEYFRLLNNSQHPQPDQTNAADALVNLIVSADGVAVNRDGGMMCNLRRLAGLYLGGEITSLPSLSPESQHSRSDGAPGNYYINFQAPLGRPTGTVTFNGHTYQKIGIDLYSATNGYGWFRPADVPVPGSFYATYDEWWDLPPADLLESQIIEDYGRNSVFEYDLPNGIYNVTVGVGSRSNPRYHTVWVEGTRVINNEATTGTAIIRTAQVQVKDKKLTLTLGKYNEITYINYMDIQAVASPVAITTAAALSQAVVNIAWSQTLAATGGTAPYTWSVVSGSLPAALSLSTGGVVSGTPTASGAYAFTARASDHAAGYAEQAFSLNVLTPYGYWKKTKFDATELAAPSISGNNADPDADGLPNLLEYAFALAPKTSDAGSGSPVMGESGGYPTFSYRRNKQATDLTFTIIASPDLSSGSWAEAAHTVTSQVDMGTYEQITVRLATPISAMAKLFLRLRVTTTE
jgi:hypothetical protein